MNIVATVCLPRHIHVFKLVCRSLELFNVCTIHLLGLSHVRHLLTRSPCNENTALHYLRHYANVVIVDGHEKLNRLVCQYQAGQRALHPQTGLNIGMQCSGM